MVVRLHFKLTLQFMFKKTPQTGGSITLMNYLAVCYINRYSFCKKKKVRALQRLIAVQVNNLQHKKTQNQPTKQKQPQNQTKQTITWSQKVYFHTVKKLKGWKHARQNKHDYAIYRSYP